MINWAVFFSFFISLIPFCFPQKGVYKEYERKLMEKGVLNEKNSFFFLIRFLLEEGVRREVVEKEFFFSSF
jgi:hypothetical protein